MRRFIVNFNAKLEASCCFGRGYGKLWSVTLAGRGRPVLGFNRDRIETAARELLLGSRVYAPLRYGYQFVFDRARFAHRQELRRFYATFVRKGDLVFDVGAHVGRHAEVFTDLGAKVVAVEPNPSCCEQLTRLAKSRDIHVEHCAAGDAPGKLKLRICEDSVISTVVEAWYEEARRSPIHRNAQWL